MRPKIGLLVAAILSAVIGAVFMGAKTLNLETAAYSLLLLTLAGYGTALFFGIWGFQLLKRLGWLTPISLALAGSSSGILFALLASTVSPGRMGWFVTFLNFLSIGAPLGAIGGFAFWWLSIRNERDALNR